MVSFFITIAIFTIFYLTNLLIQNVISKYDSFQNNNFFSNYNSEDQEKEKINTTVEKPKEKNENSKNTNTSNTTSTNQVNNTTKETKTNITENKQTNTSTKTNKNQNTEVTINKVSDIKINDWRIIIPAISLDAQISEGTSTDVMNSFVGHFENTSLWNGNIALAAHNRGYPVNYFARIKELKNGDIIEYYYGGNLRRYMVNLVTVICDTDWSFLGNTTDNKITLITCVENEPEYRRCIQGIEI